MLVHFKTRQHKAKPLLLKRVRQSAALRLTAHAHCSMSAKQDDSVKVSFATHLQIIVLQINV